MEQNSVAAPIEHDIPERWQWEGYNRDKAEIQGIGLTPDQYEKRLEVIAKKWGVWHMTDIFTEIKNRLPIEEVVARYGVPVVRGKAICPFHEDTHPSMTFKHNRFRCWACGAGGSVIDFIMLLYGLTPKEGANRLDNDFSLGLTAEGYTNKTLPERKRAALERQTNRDKVNLKGGEKVS